jgi:hypothetical protein
MSEESLRELLAKVHERLNQTGPVDTESRDLLRTVMRDIERTLGASAPAAGEHAASLESLAVRFEVDHPQLAEVLRQLNDALGKAGI